VVANTDAGLALSENTLPEMLSGYESACVGKWHLAGNQGTLHPNNSGFGHFAGSVRGALTSYTQWTKVIDGQSSMSTTYATTDTANEAVAAMSSMNAPWFLNVNFNAPHAPYHVPPAALCSTSGCANPTCGNLPMNPSNLQLGKAMLEALDAEIGRVVAALDALDPDALVVFIGDNGTAQAMSQAPFLPGHAKDTVYEGGVNVPLIVRGRGVVHAECDALVSAVDLFATLAELARVPSATEDSVSMVPYFRNPRLVLRETVYAETFSPNGGAPPFASHERAVRNARYKLIRRSGQADLFFDLMSDPFEATNLFGALTPSEQLEYDALEAELIALGVG
jgi:arylsulfatase A-like enzyme